MSRRKAVRTFVALCGLVTAGLSIDPAPANAFGIRNDAACDNPAVLRAISKRFAINDRNVIQRGLAIEDYYDVHRKSSSPLAKFRERRSTGVSVAARWQ